MSTKNDLKTKYQVFISSTFSDLKRHRAAARDAILHAGHLPLCLEDLPPQGEGKDIVISNAIANSQYYVVIVGHRYGTIPKGQAEPAKSYTHLEYERAKQLADRNKLQILPFLLDEGLAVAGRKKLDHGRTADSQELQCDKEYWKFRELLSSDIKGAYHAMFKSPRDIETALLLFFGGAHPDVPGYTLQEDVVTTRNPFVRKIAQKIDDFEQLGPRFEAGLKKKEALALAFANLHGLDIERAYRWLFIESGSTTAIVANALADALRRAVTRPRPLLVCTNNAIAYLYLWLCARVMCYPFPDTPPERQFGGMYGPLAQPDRRPDYDQLPLEEYDPQVVALLRELARQLVPPTARKHSLILAASSGMQISDQVSLKARQGQSLPAQPVLKKVECCRGFHTGSYENRLFKRALYTTGVPAIVFVHDEKIDCEIVVDYCHFVCDNGFTWEKLTGGHPLSIWVACTKESYKEKQALLETNITNGGWKFPVYDEAGEYPIVIGHNMAFRNAADKIGVKVWKEHC